MASSNADGDTPDLIETLLGVEHGSIGSVKPPTDDAPRPLVWRPWWAVAIDLAIGATIVWMLLRVGMGALPLGPYLVIPLIVLTPLIVLAGVGLLLVVIFLFKGGRALFSVICAGGLFAAALIVIDLAGLSSALFWAGMQLFAAPQ